MVCFRRLRASAKRAFPRSPVRENRTPGSVRGRPGQPGVLPRYDPVVGRWPSRDPIGEPGGANLYGFVGNDGVNLLDYLGMMWFPTLYTGEGDNVPKCKCDCPKDVGTIRKFRFTLDFKATIKTYTVQDPMSFLTGRLKDEAENEAKRHAKCLSPNDVLEAFSDGAESLAKWVDLGNHIREVATGGKVFEIHAKLKGEVCKEDGEGGYTWKPIEGNGLSKPSDTALGNPEALPRI